MATQQVVIRLSADDVQTQSQSPPVHEDSQLFPWHQADAPGSWSPHTAGSPKPGQFDGERGNHLPSDSLWRAVRERYRFGRLHLLKPAPILYMQMVLKQRVDQRAFVRSLGSHLVFALVFFAVIYQQRPVQAVYELETSLASFFDDLSVYQPDNGQHIDLTNIKRASDVFLWTNDALLPAILGAPEVRDGRTIVNM